MKRFFDLFISIPLSVVALPVMFLIGFVLLLSIGAPVIYRQERPGKNNSPFTLYKFRTMADITGSDGEQLPDDQRLTGIGKFLRSTSLDELPSLVNVVKGEMSLVGPRPLLMEYLQLYSPEQIRRHEVLPGITGWAQVNGRNAIDWETKFEYDLWYVDNRSFWLDIKILWMTLVKVFVREGITQEGHVSMEKFTGANSKKE